MISRRQTGILHRVNLLPFTFSILALLAIITYGKLHETVDRAEIYFTLRQHLVASRKLENAYQKDLYGLKCTINRKPGPKVGSKRSPRSQNKTVAKKKGAPKKHPLRAYAYKFNLGLALHNQGIYREIAEKLICKLYPEHTEHIPELLNRLTASLKAEGGFQGDPTLPEDLAALDVGDLRALWLSLLEDDLLDHITLHPERDERIYIAFAPYELLSVIFKSPTDVEALITKTESLKKSYMKNDNESKKYFRDKLQGFASKLSLTDPEYAKLLSYTLSYKPKSITITIKDKTITLKRRRLTTPVI